MEKKIIDGDITECNADIIGHVVNCNFVMGAGVAKALRNKWPVVYKNYKAIGDERGKKFYQCFMGYCQVIPISGLDENGEIHVRSVANLFCERDAFASGVKIDYEALRIALYELKRLAVYNHPDLINTIAFPYLMGAGLAGGDWNVVDSIIDSVFGDTNLTIEYWRLSK